MQRVALRDVDLASFRAAVGPEGCADGTAAVQRGAVVQMAWEASQQLLTGTVRDSGGEIRTVSASFRASPGFPLRFREGYCSCPIATNCPHVAALVLAATDETLLPGPAVPGTGARRSALPWEQSLDSLLAAPPPQPAPPAGDVIALAPLAVELSLVQNPVEPVRYPSYSTDNGRYQPPVEDPTRKLKLQARLVQPGRLGGWVAGNLSWSRLDYLQLRDEFPPAHVRLLHELYALYRASNQHYYASSYSFTGHGDQKYLDLSACESRQLWPVLEQAYAAGLPFVYRGKQGTMPPPATADLCLDVTSDGSTLLIAATIEASDIADAVPLRFVGSDGHGVIYADRAQAGRGELARFRLAKLAHPVAAQQIQQLALADERLVVPEAEQAAFMSKSYPRLRRQFTVTSSDDSFTAPEISGPSLVVRADYSSGHHVDIRWEWAYLVGGTELRAALGAPRDPFRDPEAETRILAGVNLPAGSLGAPREAIVRPLPGRPGGIAEQEAVIRSLTASRQHGANVTLHGLDVMEFSTEVLPLLEQRDDLRVELHGSVPDYHEAGDSLEIGVSTDELDGNRDWFDLGISVTVEGVEVPFSELFVALAHRQTHMLLPTGAYFSLDKPELTALAGLIDEARALQDQPDGRLRISRFQASLWEELTSLGEVGHQAGDWQRQVRGLLDVAEIEQVPVPPALQAQLRPYQLAGFQWLTFLWTHGLGGILADDMGLGKTLQTLALLQHVKDMRVRDTEEGASVRQAPFLIVAPTSVLTNWSAEAHRFAPDLKVVLFSDTVGRRGGTLADMIDGADAVVTSYTLLRLDFDAYSAHEWAGLILDEAQYVKNHQSKAYQCARRLAAPFKVAITGTPMENNLMELWSLLSITAPGLFPSPDRFKDFYAKPIEKFANADLLSQLRRRIRPLIMRRTKEQVAADLPEKQEQVLEVELHPSHRKVYQTHLQRERQKVLGLLDDVNHNRFTILRSLTLLRQLSLSAALVDAEHADVPSAKIDSLLEQIEDVVGGGHRALVFSQFTRFLRMARARLESNGVECCYLDGTTTNRGAVISSFKEGTAPVFLISLKAGGFGLNLTEADYCFLLDPWWNPATEAQAVDRTHRIGQTRNVMVYRLIASGTIEEKVMALKARKAELFSSVIDSDGAFSSALSADDIRALFA